MKMTKTLGVAAAMASASILLSAVPAAAEVDYTFLSAKTNFLVDTDDFVTSKTTFTSANGLTCLKGACASTVTFTPTTLYDEVTLSSGVMYKFAPTAFTDTTVTYKAGGAMFSTLEVSAAPEPASWALMIVGVGLMGGMMRSGRRSGVALTAA